MTAEIPWHREKMLWLVIALPLSVVIAGFVTLAIAIRTGGADAGPDEVRRSAQIQTSDLAPDRKAAALGLAGRLSVDAETGAIRLALTPKPAPTALTLLLIHPARAAEDQSLTLTPTGGDWLGRLPDLSLDHDWLVQLLPEDRQWRLQGRLKADTGATLLEPALAAR
jgi:hypothetical protein